MPKGYWIGHVSVADPEMYKKYIEAGSIAYKKYNARFLVRGGQYTGVEGENRERNVVLEFDSYEQALACYNSPEYETARKIRQACSSSDLIIIEGAD